MQLPGFTTLVVSPAKYIYYQRKLLYSHSGDDSIEVPPVPIPNTEVKLYYAESTDLDTNREDREKVFTIVSTFFHVT